jgi:hypothetical protein
MHWEAKFATQSARKECQQLGASPRKSGKTEKARPERLHVRYPVSTRVNQVQNDDADCARPLECGGADSPGNMQWQTVAAGKAKDKTERNCRL